MKHIPEDVLTVLSAAEFEGPNLSPTDFLDLFCKANKCRPTETVNRIEYEFI